MAVHLWSRKISYFPVPKVACSSLKFFFFEVENGFPFRQFMVNGDLFHIHHTYPSGWGTREPFWTTDLARIADHRRFCVARDPIERLVSAYADRVLVHRDIDPAPRLGEFIDRLEEHQEKSPAIHHHTRPMTDFIGPSPNYYERVFDIRETEALAGLVRKATGSRALLGRHNAETPRLDVSQIDKMRRRRLETYYLSDYAFLAAREERAHQKLCARPQS
jgi:hypothetical protein